MKSVRPSSARHQTSSELINDENLTIFYNVINVPLKENVCTERLIDMMKKFNVIGIVQISNVESLFHLVDSRLGESSCFRFFVDGVICFGSKFHPRCEFGDQSCNRDQ